MRSEINGEEKESSYTAFECDIIEKCLKDFQELSLIEKTFSLSKMRRKKAKRKASKFNFLYGGWTKELKKKIADSEDMRKTSREKRTKRQSVSEMEREKLFIWIKTISLKLFSRQRRRQRQKKWVRGSGESLKRRAIKKSWIENVNLVAQIMSLGVGEAGFVSIMIPKCAQQRQTIENSWKLNEYVVVVEKGGKRVEGSEGKGFYHNFIIHSCTQWKFLSWNFLRSQWKTLWFKMWNNEAKWKTNNINLCIFLLEVLNSLFTSFCSFTALSSPPHSLTNLLWKLRIIWARVSKKKHFFVI